MSNCGNIVKIVDFLSVTYILVFGSVANSLNDFILEIFFKGVTIHTKFAINLVLFSNWWNGKSLSRTIFDDWDKDRLRHKCVVEKEMSVICDFNKKD